MHSGRDFNLLPHVYNRQINAGVTVKNDSLKYPLPLIIYWLLLTVTIDLAETPISVTRWVKFCFNVNAAGVKSPTPHFNFLGIGTLILSTWTQYIKRSGKLTNFSDILLTSRPSHSIIYLTAHGWVGVAAGVTLVTLVWSIVSSDNCFKNHNFSVA